jgi:hypothetical protein
MHLVGLYTYRKMMHGAYNVKLLNLLSIITSLQIRVFFFSTLQYVCQLFLLLQQLQTKSWVRCFSEVSNVYFSHSHNAGIALTAQDKLSHRRTF